jgi:putative transposase
MNDINGTSSDSNHAALTETLPSTVHPAPVTTLSPLTSLSEEQRALALERFRLLQPHLEQGVPLTTIAQENGILYRTASRWVALYRRFGLVALARKGRADRGKRRVLSPEMHQAVEGLALQRPPLPIAILHRQAQKIAQQHEQKLPSYSVIYHIVKSLPPDLTMLAHEGTKAYSETFDLVHRQEAEGPNDTWQADHTLLDIVLMREKGEPARPWLTTIIDDHSRAIAGYFLSFEPPCAIQTALALRQAIWRKADARWRVCGIPTNFYTDNGTDFTSLHMEQVAADLKMRLVFSLPGRPRGRGKIERFFSTLSQMCLADQPGYLPPQGGMRGKPTLTLSEVDALIKTFLLDVYHEKEHTETKMSPAGRWEQGTFLPRMPESLESLDLLLLTVAKHRKVHPDGIRFQGMRYVDTALAAYVGESLLLRYDPRDMAEVRLFHEGRFVCRAICPELAGETLSLREIVKARNERRRDLRETLHERKKAVDSLIEIKGGEERPPSEPLDPTDSPQTVSTNKSTLKRYYNE